MPALAPTLRSMLEKTVIAARDVAEDAALIALQRLAVDAANVFPSMSPEQCDLRTTLRARGKQLGDGLERARPDAAGRLETMPGLVTECAYEHWHRLLFARFLAENGLLMHPDGVAISLAECEELAPEEGLPDGWAVATRYAARMLPQIFRPDDPLLRVTLAPESRQALERKVADLPAAVFLADDGLGWVYQFWQARRKKQVNDSGEKIDGRTISAVTQLFTEHYMVAFLLHNSLGAWWAARHPGQPLPLADGEVDYLRRLEDGTPAAGGFPGWPDRAAELRILDPCGGSGHFMVAALDLLSRMRALEEGLSERDAVDAALRDNLFMLEIDPRCTQIAAFALALAAWRRGGYRELPQPHVACSGLPVTAEAKDWARLATDEQRHLRFGLRQLHALFQQAPELGSLIDPRVVSEAGLASVDFAEIRDLLRAALEREEVRADPEQRAIGVVAQGLAEAADILAGRYHLVITNVPYLLRRKQGEAIQDYARRWYPNAANDLATIFVDRCTSLLAQLGTFAAVTPQNWLFLIGYERLRKYLLSEAKWLCLVRLGSGAFQTITGEIVNVVLLILSNGKVSAEGEITTIDASEDKNIEDKAHRLASGVLNRIAQLDQAENPDSRITIATRTILRTLADYADCYKGTNTGDDPMVKRAHWELAHLEKGWVRFQGTPEATRYYGGCYSIVRLHGEYSLDDLVSAGSASIRGRNAWRNNGVAVSQMGKLPVALYFGEMYDVNTAMIIPRDASLRPSIWAFCSSSDYNTAVRQLDQALKVTNATLAKVPFDLAQWQTVADAAGPLPEPYSDDPTQWLFKGDIATSTNPLQVAVARLLGNRWPEQEGDELAAHVDADGIVPLPAMSGELAAAERLRALLAEAYGVGWSHAREEELLAGADFAGKSLEAWLRDGFFKQHCKTFHNRPFIWHIWDGRRDGFAVLVNYHKLDARLLEKLTYTYVGDWIARQQEGQKRGEDGAEARLVAVRQLQERLKLILAGEKPYDIFVRWKKPHEQPIGWAPDLNDGVRLNIRPFMVEDPTRHAKAPSLLRAEPNIKWGIDRGTNPDGSKRDNDVHLSLAEKQAAREHAAGAQRVGDDE